MTQAYNRLAGSGSYEYWVVKNDATNDYLICQPAMYEGLEMVTSCHLFDAILYENLEDAESMLRHVEKTLGGVWFIRRVELEVSEYNKNKGETPRRYARPSTVA